MVPEAGIEPARPLSREILSLLCLPISPPGQGAFVGGIDCTAYPARAGRELIIKCGVEARYTV